MSDKPDLATLATSPAAIGDEPLAVPSDRFELGRGPRDPAQLHEWLREATNATLTATGELVFR